jgi:signal transduction histidine kinase/CheY-like chemotaxis protein
VRLGRRRAQLIITVFAVAASVLGTAVAYWAFDGQPRDLPAYFLPATLIPLLVAPLTSRWFIEAAIALDAAHTQVTEQAAQLTAVLGTAPVGIAHIGTDFRLRNVNARARDLLMPDSIGAVNWTALFTNDDERHDFEAAVTSGTALRHARWRWTAAGGLSRLVRGHIAPLYNADGARADGSVFIVEDITELADLEAQVARTQHLDLAGRLAGGMAHDFNNLLTIIRASAASISRTGPAPTNEVQAIEDAAIRGARLTRRLLAISRRDVHAPTPQTVESLLRETVDLMRHVVAPGVQLVGPTELPTSVAAIDHDGLQQALINLLINAQDALGTSGTMRLSAAERRDAKGRGWIVLGVHDDGPGMSPAVLARATEPFFSTKPSHLGTGLGLSIVTDTMQRHGGRLELQSTEGRGTDAWLWLPITAQPAGTARAATPIAPLQPVRTSLRLLLVEDEQAVREATQRVLRRIGHDVTSVESMAEALAWLARGDAVDLIVSDVMMPGGTGVDLLRTLRAEGRLTPVLLVSGFAAEEIERDLTQSERVAFLAKPWTVGELQASMQALVGATESVRGSSGD